jgi:hypothetical protein
MMWGNPPCYHPAYEKATIPQTTLDITGTIRKCQMLANTPKLLYYANIFSFGLFLFNLLVNDICDSIHNSKYLMFTDDLKISWD